jgi:hypothetical protein
VDAEWRQAWEWLKKQRKKAPHNADIWHLHSHWQRLQTEIANHVQTGTWRLQPMTAVPISKAGRESDSLILWSATDALVLKWVALKVKPLVKVHSRCLHLQDGAQRAVQIVAEALNSGEWHYVYRTDIKGYYQHIRKTMALTAWQEVTDDIRLLNLIEQYLYYSTEQGGEIHTARVRIKPHNGSYCSATFGPVLQSPKGAVLCEVYG